MAKERERKRPKWRLNLSASDDNVEFSVRGNLERRATRMLVATIVILACVLLAPNVAAEIARLVKLIFP
jgi:hypothetical protein